MTRVDQRTKKNGQQSKSDLAPGEALSAIVGIPVRNVGRGVTVFRVCARGGSSVSRSF